MKGKVVGGGTHRRPTDQVANPFHYIVAADRYVLHAVAPNYISIY